MTNAGLSINAELFRSVESSTYEGTVYSIRLNCSKAPRTHMTHPIGSAEVLLLRGVYFNPMETSDKRKHHESVPTVFKKIGHHSFTWRSVDPGRWVSLGRHDLLILKEVMDATRSIRVWFGDMTLRDDFGLCLAYTIDSTYTTGMAALRAWAQTHKGGGLVLAIQKIGRNAKKYKDRGVLHARFPQWMERRNALTPQEKYTFYRLKHRSAQYELKNDEALFCRLSVEGNTLDGECTESWSTTNYVLIVKWNGRNLTCGILPIKYLEGSATDILDKLEEPHSDVTPGPSEEREIRVQFEADTDCGPTATSELPLTFRVDFSCAKVKGQQEDPEPAQEPGSGLELDGLEMGRISLGSSSRFKGFRRELPFRRRFPFGLEQPELETPPIRIDSPVRLFKLFSSNDDPFEDDDGSF